MIRDVICDALYVVIVIGIATGMLMCGETYTATVWVLGSSIGFVFGDMYRKRKK